MNGTQPKNKVRGPNSGLWEMVHSVSEDQWRQLKAFSQVYGKGSLQWQLIELLYRMPKYDPNLVKKAFQKNDLYSLRKSAKKWLIRTSWKLSFFSDELADIAGDFEVLRNWRRFEDAVEVLTRAKQLAELKGDFYFLGILLDKEEELIKDYHNGEERTEKIARNATDKAANYANISESIRLNEIINTFLEPVRSQMSKDGFYDSKLVDRFFLEVKEQNVSVEKHPSLLVKWLMLNEFFFYIKGDLRKAASFAEAILEKLDSSPRFLEMQSEVHSKTLMNLVAYYSGLGEIQRVKVLVDKFISTFESTKQPEKYRARLLFVLFQVSIEYDLKDYATYGLEIWERDQQQILLQKNDIIKGKTILLISSYLLGKGQFESFKRIFGLHQKLEAPKGSTVSISMEYLLHLIILFKDKDALGLESFGRNYKRRLKKQLPLTFVAIEVLKILTKKQNIQTRKQEIAAFEGLLALLIDAQSDAKLENSLWYQPLIQWLRIECDTKSYL